MATQQVFVVRNETGWKVTYNGRYDGSYPTHQDAARTAVGMRAAPGSRAKTPRC